ncbi:MAG: hypothetical protein KKE20_04710, partial [Nanoarchaeota archaeon]|nr:hypothetical protein [Nanoarchaeota archaeon]
IEFWYNPISGSQRQSGDHMSLFTAYNETTSEYLSIWLGGKHQPILIIDLNHTPIIVSEGSYFFPFQDNEWHHVAFAFNSSNLTVSDFRLYIDGYLAGSSISNLTQHFNFDMVRLGGEGVSVKIDELIMSRNFRSSSEIKQHAGNRSIFYVNVTNKTIISPQKRLTFSSNLSYSPKISADFQGNLHVIYNEMHNKSDVKVYYIMKNSTSWSAPQLASDADKMAYLPDLAVDQNSTIHAVWEEFSPDDLNISYVHYKEKYISGDWNGDFNVSYPSYNSFATHDYYGRQTISSYFPKAPTIIVDDYNVTKIAWDDNSDFPDPYLTFYASFDESLNATYSAGSPIVEAGAVTFDYGPNTSDFHSTPFVARQGVNITSKSPPAYLNYSVDSNFNISKGAMSFWYKPNMNMSLADNNLSEVMFSFTPTLEPLNLSNPDIPVPNSMFIFLVRYGDALLNMFIFYDKDATIDTVSDHTFVIVAQISDWSYEWKHFGYVWYLNESGNGTAGIFIDGELGNLTGWWPSPNAPIAINETASRFFFGAMYYPPSYSLPYDFMNQSDGIIDELKIYDNFNVNDLGKFYGEMIKDYDILYREKSQGTWSNVSIVSNESDYMALNPSITVIGNTTYISWSQADDSCDLASNLFTHCALFRTVAAEYDGVFHQLGIINDESDDETFFPEISSYLNNLYYLWEDSSDISGTDKDIQFRYETNSTKPNVTITTTLNSQIFSVTNFSAPSHNITLEATASDPDAGDSVESVAFYYTAEDVTGGLACNATGPSPFTCSWNFMNIFEDFYRIKAVATSSDSGRNWNIHNDTFYLETSPAIIKYYINEPNSNNAAFKSSYYDSPENWPNVSSGALGNLINNDYSEIDALADSDNNYQLTFSGISPDFINSLVAVFNINQSPDNIKTLNIYWKGHGYEVQDYMTNMSIWNFNTSSWQSVAYKDFITSEDDIFKYSISDDFDHYLHPQNNSVFILIQTEDHNNPPKPPPCPIYSSWNGSDYVFEAEGLLGILNKQMESTTYHKLDHAYDLGGRVKVKVAEIVPEVTYLNQIELLAVSHADDVQAYIDLNGNPRTINPLSVQNVKCSDRFGNDCSYLVSEVDESPSESASSLHGGLVSSRSNTDPAPLE